MTMFSKILGGATASSAPLASSMVYSVAELYLNKQC